MIKLRNKDKMDLSSLVRRLKTEDTRNKRLAKSFQWLMLAMIPLYSYIFIFNPNESYTLSDRLIGLGYGISFATFAVFFWLRNKAFKEVDYSSSTLQMLTEAAKRYRFKLSQKQSLILIIPVILIDINTCVFFIEKSTLFGTPIQTILWLQLLFVGSLSISASVGYLIWRKKGKPLRDYALSLIKELEAGDGNG